MNTKVRVIPDDKVILCRRGVRCPGSAISRGWMVRSLFRLSLLPIGCALLFLVAIGILWMLSSGLFTADPIGTCSRYSVLGCGDDGVFGPSDLITYILYISLYVFWVWALYRILGSAIAYYVTSAKRVIEVYRRGKTCSGQVKELDHVLDDVTECPFYDPEYWCSLT